MAVHYRTNKWFQDNGDTVPSSGEINFEESGHFYKEGDGSTPLKFLLPTRAHGYPNAPVDGNAYGLLNSNWTPVTVPADLAAYLLAANNLSDVANVVTSLTNLGGTTVGRNIFTAGNPSAVVWVRVNADNSISFRSDSQTRTDLGLVIGTDVQAYSSVLAALHTLGATTFGTTSGTFAQGNDFRFALNFSNHTRNTTQSVSTVKLSSVLIPANTVKVGDSLMFNAMFSKDAGTNTAVCRMGINSSDSISGITPIGIFTITTGTTYAPLQRRRFVRSATETVGGDNALNAISDSSAQSIAYDALNIDWTSNLYFITSGSVTNAANTLASEGMWLSIQRAS